MERPRWLLHVQWVGVIAEDHLGLEMHLSQQAVNVSLDAGNPSSHVPAVTVKNISSYARCSLGGKIAPS